jgi:GntR family transcriptional regulator, transcriptional repressor for pyruvate dehydrogenase complex
MSHIQFQHPRRVTIVQSIIDQILAQIRDKALKPGDRLPSERELVNAFAVGRSSVREALQGLVAMNVLESRPGEGTFVKANATSPLWNLGNAELSIILEKKMRLDLLQTRRIIDEAITLLTAERATDEELGAIGNCLAEYEQAMQKDDQDELVETHNRLHLSIAQASGNYFLQRVVEMLMGTLPDSLRNPEYQFPDESEREFMLANETRGHRRIYEAIVSRDKEQVRAAVQAHMDFAQSVIEGAFAQAGASANTPASDGR